MGDVFHSCFKWNIGVHVPLLLCRCTAGLVFLQSPLKVFFLQSPLKIWMHLSGIPWLQRDSKPHDTTHCSEIRVKTEEGCSCNRILSPFLRSSSLQETIWSGFWQSKIYATKVESGTKNLSFLVITNQEDAPWYDIFVRFRTETTECWWLYCVQ